MKSILPAIVLGAIACVASGEQDIVDPKTVVALDVAVELAGGPVQTSLPLGEARERALAIARDPKRHLVLRIEGIGVTGQPGLYDVAVNSTAAGVLSFYGIEEDNGRGVVAWPIDEAVGEDASELVIVFTPRGTTDGSGRETVTVTGTARFTRLRLVEE
jgi:hypothetical protein